MRRKPVDLARVRASDARLRAHAVEHAEAFDRTTRQFTEALKGIETMPTTSRGRPPEAGEATTQIALRLPVSMLAALDAYAAQHAAPGLTITRSDAVRMIIAQALEEPKPSAPRKGR